MTPGDELWQWAGTTYARTDVAEACLALQDRDGVDVDVALWICWLAARGLRPTESALVDAAAISKTLEREVLIHLRAARRGLSAPPPELPKPLASHLKGRALDLELEVERAELVMLSRLPIAKVPGAAAEDLALVSLRLFAREARLGDMIDFASFVRIVFP